MSFELFGLYIGVQQICDLFILGYDGKGFKSVCSGSGNYSQQFNLLGIYFYLSGEVDFYGVIVMKGKVIVNDFKIKFYDVKVLVGGVEVFYNLLVVKFMDFSFFDCQLGVISVIL